MQFNVRHPGEKFVRRDENERPLARTLRCAFHLAAGVRAEDPALILSNMKNPVRGCAPFVYDEHLDRPESIFGGITTLHFGSGRQPHVTVPLIPSKG